MSRPEDTHDHRDHLRGAEGFTVRLEWPPGDRRYFLGLAAGTFALHVDPDDAFHFDLEGRLRRAFTRGRNYLRGLDGAVLRKTVARGKRAVSAQGPLEPGEAADVFRRTHEQAVHAARSFDRSRVDLEAEGTPGPVFEHVRALLGRAEEYDPARLAAESERFAETYAPLSILPPDRYRALILQATVGCSYGKCAFCSLYRGVPYHRKSVEEFRAHVCGVKALLGRALCLKSGVFLAEANALEIPFESLEPIFGVLHDEVPGQATPAVGRRGGVSAFTDVFQGRFRTRAELMRLKDMGLDRVYLGVESGDDAVLESLRKPGSRRAAVERVRSLKEAGISAGVIFLVGAGGPTRRREHVDHSVSLVEEFELDDGDIVYLSPLYWPDRPDPEAGELESEERELRERLRALGARVSRYDLKSFVYY